MDECADGEDANLLERWLGEIVSGKAEEEDEEEQGGGDEDGDDPAEEHAGLDFWDLDSDAEELPDGDEKEDDAIVDVFTTEGLEQDGYGYVTEVDSGLPVGRLRMLVMGTPYINAICSRHERCQVVMTTIDRFHERWDACALWLSEGRRCTAEDHRGSLKNLRRRFHVRVRS